MTLTLAETLFEKVLCERGIEHRRIPAERDRRTPDYLVSIDGLEIAAEVKQINRNSEEEAIERAREEGRVVVTSGTPGGRVRKLITDARGQLAPDSERGQPTLLVVYDNTMHGHADGYNVLVAMYGLQTIVLSVPQPYGETTVKGQKFGPKRKMTSDTNTGISAIGVIRTPARVTVTFETYHNWHARVPLAPVVLGSYGIPQFRLPGDPAHGFREWEEITVG
jgi:hypothetical protein